MEIKIERRVGILILALNGRLDGAGAGVLAERIKANLNDDDQSVVVDMGGVPCLSSAGIRVLLATKKQLKARNGTLALTGVKEFPKSVLDMTGFSKVIDQYPAIDAALTAAGRVVDRTSLIHEFEIPVVKKNGVSYRFEPPVRGKASLRVYGNLDKVLLADLTAADIRAIRFNDLEYSLGLGALGKDVNDALPVLGEMITLHGSMVWLPTDGNNIPDFFTPVKDTGEVKVFTGFDVALDGPFNQVVTFEAGSEEGVAVSDLYRAIFDDAKARRSDFNGIAAVVCWGVVAGVCSSGVQHAPIRESAPSNHKSIMDPENYDLWIDSDPIPKYRGDTIVSFGFGVDLTANLAGWDQDALRSLYYVHPENRGRADMHLHNHGVIFRGIPWDPTQNLNPQVKRCVTEGEFVDMRHLMDSTRIRHGKCGISYISEIIPEV